MSMRTCPALLITAPSSGQGKTTVTAALARYHREQGRIVRVFKTGPDFLDPMILERASGHPVYQLDLWMGGEAHCRELLYQAAAEADLILVEGVMGLFDGAPSSADLAATFGIPVLAVIDASAMAQTFGAIAYGLANYRTDIKFFGVLANRVASPGHADMLKESLPPGVGCFATLPRDAELSLPDRHLGLVQAQEIADLDQRIAHAAKILAGQCCVALPEPTAFVKVNAVTPQRTLAGIKIAVARDAAFSFLYHANVDALRALGAELEFFSPLTDTRLPEADSLYLPGGYPELHLQQLQANGTMRDAIRMHHATDKPILAECGGMLYLLETLSDSQGCCADMVGLLPGHAVMQKKLVNLGMHSVTLPVGEFRGHTFHHSNMETSCAPFAMTSPARARGKPEAVYQIGRLHASYLHYYLPSNLSAAARFFTP
ncbi:cobyrinic acid A,C-diamide synthase [mine drainage metagenome]|uniref:Cobyrinic acid A,C-diamide synthase n=1 Tax=mine drainage metagenome TaxID=410659 RepID=A0A1J5SC78_9ZZZZ